MFPMFGSRIGSRVDARVDPQISFEVVTANEKQCGLRLRGLSCDAYSPVDLPVDLYAGVVAGRSGRSGRNGKKWSVDEKA